MLGLDVKGIFVNVLKNNKLNVRNKTNLINKLRGL